MSIKDRGFASMPKNKARKIQSAGGKASGRVRSNRAKQNNS